MSKNADYLLSDFINERMTPKVYYTVFFEGCEYSD